MVPPCPSHAYQGRTGRTLLYALDLPDTSGPGSSPGLARSQCPVRTTLTIDEDFLRAVKQRSAGTGEGESKLIGDAVRRDPGLGTLRDLWARVKPMPEAEAVDLALEAQYASRKRSAAKRS